MGQIVEQNDLAGAPRRLELGPFLGVVQRYRQRDLGSAARSAGHADPALDQRAQHGEEAFGLVLNGSSVGAVGLDLPVSVQQRGSRYPHSGEPQLAVVDAVQPGLETTIGDPNARLGRALGVPDRHQEGMHAVALATGHQLGEHDRQSRRPARRYRCTPCGTSRPECRSRTRRWPGRRSPWCPGRPRPSRGRARSWRSSRAAFQWRYRQIPLVVLGVTQMQDGSAEQPELHAGFDHQ